MRTVLSVFPVPSQTNPAQHLVPPGVGWAHGTHPVDGRRGFHADGPDADPQENDVDKDRLAGAAEQAKGSLKEAIGKITGNAEVQAEGAAEKSAGKAQNTAGGAKDAVRGIADK